MLKKILCGGVVDVHGDLIARIEAQDQNTIDLLKTVYPIDQAQKCLLYKEKFIPGCSPECSLKCVWDDDVYVVDYETECNCKLCGSLMYMEHRIDMMGRRCYRGRHIATKQEEKQVFLSL
jgi:hypothetical protein